MSDAALPAISLRGVTKTFGETTAVDSLDLDIRPGEFFSMLGPSGSGKTTVLRLIAGFEQPDSGQVSLFGEDVTRSAPFQRDVNTVFQDYALFPHMNVLDNVAYGLRVRGVDKKERRDRSMAALESVRLAHVAARKPTELSGGQRQRVALARATVVRPKALLLDEPLGALDLKLREQMQVELKELQRSLGITFIFVTHDQDEALTLSDRIAVFDSGRIVQLGTPKELYERPSDRFVAEFVGTSNVFDDASSRQLLGRPGVHSIRPERVVLRAEPSGAASASHPGVVAEVIYSGMSTKLIVDLDQGERLSVIEQNLTARDELDRRGQRVHAEWSAVDVVELEPAPAAPVVR
jgi:putative spermidine/putrescine transport system ATP-binding protein